MPKIIENLESRLLAEAEKQITENGYAGVTIRSIAKGCGVGIGTVYNYFPSKEVLIASHLLEDWMGCVAEIEATAATAGSPRPVARCIYDQLSGFSARHMSIFRDEAAAAGFAGSFGQYHKKLREQLSRPLSRFCANDFCAAFIAESLLTWTMAGQDFDELYAVMEKLF